jgi:hypothetical protein
VIIELVGLSELSGESAHTVRLDGCSAKGNIVTTSQLRNLHNWESVLDRNIIPLHLTFGASTIGLAILLSEVLGLGILNNSTFAGMCRACNEDQGKSSEFHNLFHHD